MHPLITGERFAKRNIPFSKRLQRPGFDDFALQAEQQIRAVEDQITVCQAELDAQQQEKRILVQKLHTDEMLSAAQALPASVTARFRSPPRDSDRNGDCVVG